MPPRAPPRGARTLRSVGPPSPRYEGGSRVLPVSLHLISANDVHRSLPANSARSWTRLTTHNVVARGERSIDRPSGIIMPGNKKLSTAYSKKPTDVTTDNETGIQKPSWDTSPNSLPAFMIQLKKWLPTADSRYKALIEYGFVRERGKLYCMSDNHIDRIIHKTLPKGTFEKPTDVARGTHTFSLAFQTNDCGRDNNRRARQQPQQQRVWREGAKEGERESIPRW